MKKILVICQYYYPEPFRITDVCEELVRRGHEVHVVTGYPNYPEGIIYKGYGKGKHINEIINGVYIHRCYTLPRGKGFFQRFLNYYSYSISSIKFVLSKECRPSKEKRFDVVFCNQLSPVMMGSAAIAYKKKYRVPIVLYCLDLWPESLVAGGIQRNSLIYKYYHYVSQRIYRSADKIVVTSKMFIDYMNKEFKINTNKIQYLPQYAEKIFNSIMIKQNDGYFHFMFAGNIGEIQSVETILKAAEKLKDAPVKMHIVGGGTDLERLKAIKEEKQLDNVIFYGRRPLEEMPFFYNKADCMLVTLKGDPVLSMTLPGKVQSYLAFGKPIIGSINGEAEYIINEANCGYCGRAENVDELVLNIKKYINNENKNKLGQNARKYYETHFDSNIFFRKLESLL